MTWRTVYDEATGGDVANGGYLSVATVVTNPLPAGFASKIIVGPPQEEEWNITTLEWEPRPPPLPDVDRIDEFLSRVGNALKGNAKTKVQTELAILLGDTRFRDSTDVYEIGVP